MGEISILDLQNLRHLIGGYATTYSKMTDYASQTEDPKSKNYFRMRRFRNENKAELMKFL